jgi:hypothetical protein
VRTTIADPAAARPPDLVDRQFGVSAAMSRAIAVIRVSMLARNACSEP